ncbi:MAG: hypothetical protein WBZ48_07650 [Bacteroidota bacterium]
MKKFTVRFRLFALGVFIVAIVSLAIVLVPASVNAQYTGTGNHVVTADQAVKFIQNFKQKPVAPTTKGGYFDRNIFDKILAQPGVVGIRYYYAAKDDGTPTVVLVGVDSTGSDMVQGVIGEWGSPCPPICGSQNQLSK